MENFWSDLLQNLLMAFAPVIASLLAGLLYAQIRKVWAQFKAEKPDVAWALESAARMAVLAAEQAGAKELIEDKKAYAMNVAEKWLATKGITLDLDLIDAAIEAAVYDELNRQKDAPAHLATGFIKS
jgi:hypothetical protein